MLNKIHDDEWLKKLDGWKKGFNEYYPVYTNQLFGEERRKTKLHKIIDENAPMERPVTQLKTGSKNSLTNDIRQFLKANALFASQVGSGDSFLYPPSYIADGLGLTGKDRDNVYTILRRLRNEEAQEPP